MLSLMIGIGSEPIAIEEPVISPSVCGVARSTLSTKGTAMEFITMIVIGLLVGIVAKFLMPGDDPGGLIVTILLGIAGSFVAHYIGVKAGWYTQSQPAGFIASVVGAIILLLAYRLLFRRRRREP